MQRAVLMIICVIVIVAWGSFVFPNAARLLAEY